MLLDEAHTASRFPDVAWLLGACCSPQVIVLQNEGGATYRAAPDNFSINSLTSLATLDVDRLANKNQARLAKLHALQGECVGSDFSPTVTRNVLTSLVANLCEKFTGNPAIKPQAAASTYFSFDMKLVRLGKVVRHSLRQLVKVQLLDCRRRVRASFPIPFFECITNVPPDYQFRNERLDLLSVCFVNKRTFMRGWNFANFNLICGVPGLVRIWETSVWWHHVELVHTNRLRWREHIESVSRT